MAKEILTKIKLQVKGGQANPAPPVGPALGQAGLNIQEFCTRFNAASKDKMGQVVPVEITVYKDRSYTFVMKEPPASELLKQVAGIQKGSGKALTEKIGSITRAQLREAAQKKLPDLNTKNIEAAMKILEGTARQMGLEIK
ncbi:50S ribosomal protein L11 [Candidatus Falkowbacteria bacterium RIFOXYC2_FULL_47_12]|uniref:Large ribosomal subunit protein uL11 n=2 Tax=Candidatus Falkowiibacteriota TaxID=1752728 RepID=A0A1F5TLU5_9BACT|nr:MAG: 50S ribosomal protein L11 [Candidatus Falkowbacteria bacterium RIFOXYA2_FULL_47_9]OGF39834.1 MAG: 50S ribosomal protein L11 [Candidatus Falkowbacteria bacterium RIFOXYC2_FULL_47_12]